MEQKSNGFWELDHEERALSMAQKDQVLHLGAGPWALSDVAHTTHLFKHLEVCICSLNCARG